MPDRTSPWRSGAVVADRYRLERLVGAGAMGAVFATECGAAIKLLETREGHGDPVERRARFLREAEICGRLAHPNLVPVLDHGIDPATDTPYFVMPLLSGEDLGSLLTREGPLEPDVAVALFVQACQGVHAAHVAGIVHRDIKPSNVFLVHENGVVTVKVADFGLAKVAGELAGGLTTSHAFMGSAQYVSPEQATNAKHADVRTDVWSVAMTLYHALAGRPAFARAGSFMAFLVELRKSSVPALQDAAPWVDFRVARVVHGALLRDADRRCPSVVELMVGLDMAVGIDVSRRPTAPASLTTVSAKTQAVVAERALLPASWAELLRS